MKNIDYYQKLNKDQQEWLYEINNELKKESANARRRDFYYIGAYTYDNLDHSLIGHNLEDTLIELIDKNHKLPNRKKRYDNK